jgi:radical SAM superfamily enzyme YgiQ (UPF0313 family)
MKQPIWLFSMDSEHFSAAPMTTGGLKAYYHKYGRRAQDVDIRLVHFLERSELKPWLSVWEAELLPVARAAVAEGLQPIAGFSFYTWNAAEFLDLVRALKQSCPELIVIAGGPHVQQATDYLGIDPIDVIVLGEGEATFAEWLDAPARADWHNVAGLAFVESNTLITTTARERCLHLDTLPSALDVISLTNADGEPLYDSVAYETSRGCPYKCSFCEWGTGAIGTKMYQFSMERIKRDWDIIIGAGIKNIWLADSNFGALKDDVEKTRMICEMKNRTGLPTTFATSWSKKHSTKVQEIVLMLHNNGLLPHYQLALQTLTPLALELSNRQNMAQNKFEPIAKQMAEHGVPIAAELIWGLPGDTLQSFETNLDMLLTIFPNINIFGYTLLPGTEFYRRRDEYEIKTVPVAGYGKAKGEYVIGCHTFGTDEGIRGYFLITAHMMLIHGHLMPLTTKFLALNKRVPVSPLLRQALSNLVDEFGNDIAEISADDALSVYEYRADLYLHLFDDVERLYDCIRRTCVEWLGNHGAADLVAPVMQLLQLDMAFAPRTGEKQWNTYDFAFNAREASRALEAMELPPDDAFTPSQCTMTIMTPGGVGTFLKDPDGGHWLRGKEEENPVQLTNAANADMIAVSV